MNRINIVENVMSKTTCCFVLGVHGSMCSMRDKTFCSSCLTHLAVFLLKFAVVELAVRFLNWQYFL